MKDFIAVCVFVLFIYVGAIFMSQIEKRYYDKDL